MPPGLTSGIGPWLLAGVGLAFIFALITTLRELQDARFSPFYLLRQQAARRARTSALFSFLLMLLVCGLSAWFGTQPALEVTLPEMPDWRIVLLGTPPPQPNATPVTDATSTPPAPTAPPTAPNATPTLSAPPTRPPVPTLTRTPTPGLPPELVTPVTPLSTALPGTKFGAIVIAAKVTEGGYPTLITDTFSAGNFPIYAVFTYTQMTSGIAWTQIWLRDNTTVRGETALWTARPSGRAFVFINPTEGWLPGAYEVQLFIGQALVQRQSFTVNEAVPTPPR